MNEDQLVDAVTRAIMERLAGAGPGAANVVAFGDVPAGVLAPGVVTRKGVSPSDVEGSAVIVMTIDAFRAFHGGIPGARATAGGCATGCAGGIDLTGKRLVNERDLAASGVADGSSVRVGAKTLLTALANDYAKAHALTIVRG